MGHGCVDTFNFVSFVLGLTVAAIPWILWLCRHDLKDISNWIACLIFQ